MKTISTYSPTSLRFIAALHGKTPAKTGTEFVYAHAACTDPDALICLAASNPEGRFYGLMLDEAARIDAERSALERGMLNVAFLAGTPSKIRAEGGDELTALPMLDYLVCDEAADGLPESEREALFDLAKKHLTNGGLFITTYKAYEDDGEALRFLVQELAPEMNPEQKQDFLTELKKLGSRYFQKHLDLADALDCAIIDKKPDAFFSKLSAASHPKAFAVLVAAGSRGFAYAGDTSLPLNFVEMAIPAESQEIVCASRPSPFYELIKDLALDRATRSDIWVKTPCETSADPADLMGGFAYGLVVARNEVPSEYHAKGKAIDLSTPLFTDVLDMMAVMPVGVGNILRKNEGHEPEKVLEVFQVLVACGYAIPMRGALTAINVQNIAQPKLAGAFNQYLDKTELTDKEILFASPIAGCGVVLSAKEALVMQALSRKGLVASAIALMPELFRISNTPARTAVMANEAPSAKTAQKMVFDVVGKSLPTWYAYGLLEAA